jgi:hypothetical protein
MPHLFRDVKDKNRESLNPSCLSCAHGTTCVFLILVSEIILKLKFIRLMCTMHVSIDFFKKTLQHFHVMALFLLMGCQNCLVTNEFLLQQLFLSFSNCSSLEVLKLDCPRLTNLQLLVPFFSINVLF